jgi:shikimate kinase
LENTAQVATLLETISQERHNRNARKAMLLNQILEIELLEKHAEVMEEALQEAMRGGAGVDS